MFHYRETKGDGVLHLNKQLASTTESRLNTTKGKRRSENVLRYRETKSDRERRRSMASRTFILRSYQSERTRGRGPPHIHFDIFYSSTLTAWISKPIEMDYYEACLGARSYRFSKLFSLCVPYALYFWISSVLIFVCSCLSYLPSRE